MTREYEAELERQLSEGRAAMELLEAELKVLRTKVSFHSNQHLIAELLTAARNELAKAISYRAADVICDGEGWDSSEQAVRETCDPCRKRSLREVGVLASILHPLDHLIDELANQLGKPIPHRWVELPAGVEGYEEQRDDVMEAWDRTMAGTNLWFDRLGLDAGTHPQPFPEDRD